MSQKEGSKLFLENLVGDEEKKVYERLHWQGGFGEYLEKVRENPKIVRTAFQRLYDMILSHGVEVIEDFRKEKISHYNLFDDPMGDGFDAIYGLDKPLMHLVNLFKAAAEGYGIEKRILLLHGPVGSSKSTIAGLLKKGLEEYTKTDEGLLYTFGWKHGSEEIELCPMHEEPLKLIPKDEMKSVFNWLKKGNVEDGEKYLKSNFRGLCPPCRLNFKTRMEENGGDWVKVLDDVVIERLVFSEEDRIGIGTFEPKDEKNQDTAELTGDLNYRKIAEYGSDSDPRAFNFDGELNIANRGLVELVELLKSETPFLYVFLGASQEQVIKPKKFAWIPIDEILLGHTNEAEYKRLQGDELMEALRDRTVKIDIPYAIKHSDEVKIYERDFNENKIKNKHIAPHTLEMAAFWTVLTRLEDPKNSNLSLSQKLKLYDGKHISGFTQDTAKELMEEATREGMEGVSPRYIQDTIGLVLSTHDEKCIDPFMVMKELKEGLENHPLIDKKTDIEKYAELVDLAEEEYVEIVKNEVRVAIAADKEALETLCTKYIDNVVAYTQKEKIKDRFTGKDVDPDETLMRSIEEKIGIEEGRIDNYRMEIMNYIGALSLRNEKFNYKSDERLLKGLESKLFEDKKDTIKWASITSDVVDEEEQKKIDVIKQRMIKNYGYCDVCSTDVLNYVASIYSRGDPKE